MVKILMSLWFILFVFYGLWSVIRINKEVADYAITHTEKEIIIFKKEKFKEAVWNSILSVIVFIILSRVTIIFLGGE